MKLLALICTLDLILNGLSILQLVGAGILNLKRSLLDLNPESIIDSRV